MADYTTTYDVRREAGLMNNPYIADDWVRQNMAEAQNTIDSHLGGQYTIPFNPVPAVISRLAKILAAGYILKGEFGQAAIGTNADGQAKIDEATNMLNLIRAGEVEVVGAEGSDIRPDTGVSGIPNSETATSYQGRVAKYGPQRKFRIGQRW